VTTDGTTPPGGSGKDINYFKEALRSQYNWIGMAGVAAFALISGTALPILLGAGLELMYLSLVPHFPRFQRAVRARKYAQEKRELEARLKSLVVTLSPARRVRYEALQTVCAAIRSNYGTLSATSQLFARQMDDRLDGLLQAFLRLLFTGKQHEEYLAAGSLDTIQREKAQLEKQAQSDSPKVREINKRRVEILQKRLDKFGKIKENQEVIAAQCSAIEDVLNLIKDQSVTMRDPQQVSDQLDSLVHDVEQTEETVRQVEAIYDTGGPELSLSPAPPEPGAKAPERGSGPRDPMRS
jgi:hypothetical protein